MVTQPTVHGRSNALKRELRVQLEESSSASAEAVYDLLADLPSHLEWGGTAQKQSYRLLSIEAPEGPASVGSEFSSTGTDPMGRFADTSVVTEATRPRLFEFVTEADHTVRKGRTIRWTTVHRYELVAEGRGCRIDYTIRTVRVSGLPGPLALFNVPGLRSLLLKLGRSNVRHGLRNLARMAEAQSGVRSTRS
jgi:hypothetical protein